MLLLGVLWIGSRFSPKLSPEALLQPYNSTLYIQSGTVLGAISSPLSEKETILWEETNQLGYSYDILYSLWTCESQNRHEGVWGDNYQSYGGLQFQLPTFITYADAYKLEGLNIQDFRSQIILAIYMLKDGQENNWHNCWKQIKK